MAAVLVELASAVEDDESYLTAAQDAELVGLLYDAVAALLEGHLRSSVGVDFNGHKAYIAVALLCNRFNDDL